MYKLERTKKVKAVTICLGILSFIVSFFSCQAGGYEMLEHDFINFPFACILMVACFIAGIILLVISIAIHTIQKDVEEHHALLFKEQMEFPKNKSGSMPPAGSQRHICCLKKYCYENEPFSLLRCIYR